MPLELYPRKGVWWFRGRIDELPGSRYFRQSTGSSRKGSAEIITAAFQERQIKRYYVGGDHALTFGEAVLLYMPTEEMAKDLIPIQKLIGTQTVTTITPQQVRDMGPELKPDASTDTWQKHIVTPVRAVINNAHDKGKCPPIRIKAYSKAERLKQDQTRQKQSRIEKKPGNWEWINAFREHADPYQAALALFMFETGARIGQATALTPKDLDINNARVMMPEAKGMEAQWVDISMVMVVELANLKPRRPRKGPHGTTRPSLRVFGYAGKDGVYKRWKRICKDAGIEEIMPHAAGRHGFATEMLVRQGIDIAAVAKAGRWADRGLMQKTYVHAEGTKEKIQEALRTGRVQGRYQPHVKSMKLKG